MLARKTESANRHQSEEGVKSPLGLLRRREEYREAQERRGEHLHADRLAVRDPGCDTVLDAERADGEDLGKAGGGDSAEDLSGNYEDESASRETTDEPKGERHGGVERGARDAGGANR